MIAQRFTISYFLSLFIILSVFLSSDMALAAPAAIPEPKAVSKVCVRFVSTKKVTVVVNGSTSVSTKKVTSSRCSTQTGASSVHVGVTLAGRSFPPTASPVPGIIQERQEEISEKTVYL